MDSAEEVRRKLAQCRTCDAHQMMLADSASCPACETARRDTVLSTEDVR